MSFLEVLYQTTARDVLDGPLPTRAHKRMQTYLGTGHRYLGVGRRDEFGRCHCTKWLVVCTLPVWPVSRDLVRPRRIDAYRAWEMVIYDWYEATPLDFFEVTRTVLLGWVLIPLWMIGLPVIVITIMESPDPQIRSLLKLIGANDPSLQLTIALGGFVWMILWAILIRMIQVRIFLGRLHRCLEIWSNPLG